MSIRNELRKKIRAALEDGMTPDQSADAVMKLFTRVEEEFDAIDISTHEEPDRKLWHRHYSITTTPEGVEWRPLR